MLDSSKISAAFFDLPIVKRFFDDIFDDKWPRETVVEVLKNAVTKAIDDINGRRTSTDTGKQSEKHHHPLTADSLCFADDKVKSILTSSM